MFHRNNYDSMNCDASSSFLAVSAPVCPFKCLCCIQESLYQTRCWCKVEKTSIATQTDNLFGQAKEDYFKHGTTANNYLQKEMSRCTQKYALEGAKDNHFEAAVSEVVFSINDLPNTPNTLKMVRGRLRQKIANERSYSKYKQQALQENVPISTFKKRLAFSKKTDSNNQKVDTDQYYEDRANPVLQEDFINIQQEHQRPRQHPAINNNVQQASSNSSDQQIFTNVPQTPTFNASQTPTVGSVLQRPIVSYVHQTPTVDYAQQIHSSGQQNPTLDSVQVPVVTCVHPTHAVVSGQQNSNVHQLPTPIHDTTGNLQQMPLLDPMQQTPTVQQTESHIHETPRCRDQTVNRDVQKTPKVRQSLKLVQSHSHALKVPDISPSESDDLFSNLASVEHRDVFQTSSDLSVSFCIGDFVAIGQSKSKFDIGLVEKVDKDNVTVQYYKKKGESLVEWTISGEPYKDDIHINTIVYKIKSANRTLSRSEQDAIKSTLKDIFM